MDLGVKSIYRYYYRVWVTFTSASSLTILLKLENVLRNEETWSLVLSTADTTGWMGEPRVFISEKAVLAASRASIGVGVRT